jgi:putative DNA primase/helicase
MPFDQTFEGDNADLYLSKKLVNELDGVFMWALKGLRRLQNQGHFTESEVADMALAEYRRYNNPLVAFIQDCCELDPDETIPKDDLYKAYKNYMEDGGYFSLTKDNFFRELYAMHPELEKVRLRLDDQREQAIRGIVLVKRL